MARIVDPELLTLILSFPLSIDAFDTRTQLIHVLIHDQQGSLKLSLVFRIRICKMGIA